MYGIISKLARYSEKFYISATYGKDNINSNIYSNKVYYDLITLFKSEGLRYNINKLSDFDYPLDSVLANNLLAYNPKKYDRENNKIRLKCFDNSLDEIKYTISEIYSKVLSDKTLTFSDFAIVLPNLNDLSLLKRELHNYNILLIVCYL